MGTCVAAHTRTVGAGGETTPAGIEARGGGSAGNADTGEAGGTEVRTEDGAGGAEDSAEGGEGGVEDRAEDGAGGAGGFDAVEKPRIGGMGGEETREGVSASNAGEG